MTSALRQLVDGMTRQNPTIAPPPFEDWMAKREEPLLVWDGSRLRQNGDDSWAIWVNNRLALAASILRLTCADHAPITDAEVAAFADEVLARFQFDQPMTLHPDAGPSWLAARRA
jgi:hypothetical protein